MSSQRQTLMISAIGGLESYVQALFDHLVRHRPF